MSALERLLNDHRRWFLEFGQRYFEDMDGLSKEDADELMRTVRFLSEGRSNE